MKFNKISDQSQQGVADCYIFAIACAVARCVGNDPQKMVFNQEKKREYPVDCTESQIFTNFQFSVNTNWQKKTTTKKKKKKKNKKKKKKKNENSYNKGKKNQLYNSALVLIAHSSFICDAKISL